MKYFASIFAFCYFTFALFSTSLFSRLVLFCRLVAANSRYTKQKWISEIIKYGKAGEMPALLLTLSLKCFMGDVFNFLNFGSNFKF